MAIKLLFVARTAAIDSPFNVPCCTQKRIVTPLPASKGLASYATMVRGAVAERDTLGGAR
jgi:hypothetical protein